MISVEKAEYYRRCNSCNSHNNVKLIIVRFDGTNSGTQMPLCSKCRHALLEALRKEEAQNER